MTAQEIRQKYLDFFKSKGHAIIEGSSLIPENDPTVLFTTAGMHPLVPYFMGEKHPSGNRVVDVQRCIRTTDIEEIGDVTHHTCFEMLGNWSFGDYFKEDAIKWSFEFLTSEKWLNLDIKRLAVSVFAGDNDAPLDIEAFNIWKNLGIPEARIARLPKDANWWGPAGSTGPCGPCSEMFYWTGDMDKIPESFNDDHELWVEIWNDVFMQFYKNENGEFKELKSKSVDTGMGLERITTIINGLDDNYKTSLFKNSIKKIEYLSGKKYNDSEEVARAMRIIADHVKAATFIMGDDKGISPSNTDQGYIVRRLIRRAVRYGKSIGINQINWLQEIAKVIIYDYENIYPELLKNINFIIDNIEKEETRFSKTLANGVKKIERLFANYTGNVKEFELNQVILFDLYQTDGFPVELTLEEVNKKRVENGGVEISSKAKKIFINGFKEELKKHQDISRTAMAGRFKGGLADTKEKTKQLHTVAHLLLAGLRKVLGDHVTQKGANITEERLRFDFSHPEKVTEEQQREIENFVNNAIQKNLKVSYTEMPLEEAKKKGAIATFTSKYGENVKVYQIGEDDNIVSYEICGGPHVKNTSELGVFKIIKEKSSGAGVRRIKGILE